MLITTNFSSSALSTLDDKWRFSVPSKYRDVLKKIEDGAVILTYSPRGCVLLFPQPEWLVFKQKLLDLKGTADLPWEYGKVLETYENDQKLDVAGRVMVSSQLRSRAKLKKDVLVVGSGNYLEIWDEAHFEVVTDPNVKKDPYWDLLKSLGI